MQPWHPRGSLVVGRHILLVVCASHHGQVLIACWMASREPTAAPCSTTHRRSLAVARGLALKRYFEPVLIFMARPALGSLAAGGEPECCCEGKECGAPRQGTSSAVASVSASWWCVALLCLINNWVTCWCPQELARSLSLSLSLSVSLSLCLSRFLTGGQWPEARSPKRFWSTRSSAKTCSPQRTQCGLEWTGTVWLLFYYCHDCSVPCLFMSTSHYCQVTAKT